MTGAGLHVCTYCVVWVDGGLSSCCQMLIWLLEQLEQTELVGSMTRSQAPSGRVCRAGMYRHIFACSAALLVLIRSPDQPDLAAVRPARSRCAGGCQGPVCAHRAGCGWLLAAAQPGAGQVEGVCSEGCWLGLSTQQQWSQQSGG
jgi:hypothetical protein